MVLPSRTRFQVLAGGYADVVAGISPAPRQDRTGRLALAALTLGGVAVLLWLVATLAASAFG